MTRSTTRRTAALAATVLAAGLALTACSSDSEETNQDSSDADETTQEDAGSDDAASDEMDIMIGIPSGWDEGIAVSHLWKAMLEDQGYTVETETADIGVLFTKLDGGEVDVMFDGWLPLTHAAYWEDYGDNLTDLGTWYDNAKLTIAVNEDSPATSLADLADNADAYDNKLVGIEPGAGLTSTTQDTVIPTYGLEDMDYVTSSTPAMLAELKAKTDAGENVVVTLWRPHWAYDQFPIRDLEDPEGTLGDAEGIHAFGTGDFTERYPTAAEWIANFELTDEQLFSLENMMFNEENENYNSDTDAAAATWLEENPDFATSLME